MIEPVGIPVHIRALGERKAARSGEPVTVGIPFPRSLTSDLEAWGLFHGSGEGVSMEPRIQERWPDGSVRWALIDFAASLPAGVERDEYMLRAGAVGAAAAVLQVATTGNRLQVDTGACSVTLDSSTSGLFRAASARGEAVLGADSSTLQILGAGGPWQVTWSAPAIEAPGRCRTTVLVHGRATENGRTRVTLTLRLDFYVGSPTVRLRLSVRNPSPATHPGGIWELGDPGSQLIKELSLVLRRAGAAASSIHYSLEREGSFAECRSRLHVYQDSSGGENWRSTIHVNREGVVPMRFRGYEAIADGNRSEGLRATPVVSLEAGRTSLSVTIPQFWENFPQAIDAHGSVVTVSFWPSETSDLHELQGGEQKTFECLITFGEVTEDALRATRSRLFAHTSPEWYASAQAARFLVPAAVDGLDTYKALVGAALDGDDTFMHKRERVDEYGWRNYGDIYGDHEAVFHKGSTPLVSHQNNQYDPIGGFLYQFMRSGDERWWQQASDCARHVADIDLYHTDGDHAKYNHGLFWHTFHYVDAGKSTHRGYPAGTNGGGPSSEHNYSSGLMLHYLMTGDASSRESAISLAQFVIDIDDGRRTVLRYLDHGYTGVASASRSPYYHGPGRGSGNSLNALLDGHRLTGERRFLDKAEQIIRRSTHPRQDIAALTLLDPENRWFYTIFLQSLGKYLDYKAHLGERDAMYAYGRDVLLHFTRWMAANERPYLDHKELLEFPTETWAAQDVRKSEVFDHASRHVTGAERDTFLERAEFFHRYSLQTLAAMPTRSVARPVILLFGIGFMRASFKRHVEALPEPESDWSSSWPAPEEFVPQRLRAKRRAVSLAVVAAITTMGMMAWMFG